MWSRNVKYVTFSRNGLDTFRRLRANRKARGMRNCVSGSLIPDLQASPKKRAVRRLCFVVLRKNARRWIS